MIIRLQKYDLEVRYEKESNMFLADARSRAFLPAGEQDENEFETINMIKYLPVSEERLLQIQRDTEADESLQVLKDVIQNGWPEHRSNVPNIINELQLGFSKTRRFHTTTTSFVCENVTFLLTYFLTNWSHLATQSVNVYSGMCF